MTRTLRLLNIFLKSSKFRNVYNYNIGFNQRQRLFSETKAQNLTKRSTYLGLGGAAVVSTSVGYYLYKSRNRNEPDIVEVHESAVPNVTLPPVTSIDIPEFVPYLIIGGGSAAFSAARTIRIKDPKARVLIITDEDHLPYMKPPLSKEIWNKELNLTDIDNLTFKQWNGKERDLYFEESEYFVTPLEVVTKENGGIGVLKKTEVIGLNPHRLKVILSNGHEIAFNKCLIATGGSPKIPQLFENVDEKLKGKILTYRTADDYKKISRLIQTEAKVITIVGGGFLGSELASSLSRHQEKLGLKINQVYPENGIIEPVLPHYLSDFATQALEEGHNIKMYRNKEIKAVKEGPDGTLKLELASGEIIKTDIVLLATGIKPNDELAAKAGLEIDSQNGGVLVNSEFAVTSNIWSAGDVASFYDPKLQCRRRIEHHDHSLISGKLAAENMLGAGKRFAQQSMLWCDLTENLSLEAIGLVDSTLQTVGVFRKSPEDTNQVTEKTPQIPKSGDKYEKGVVFYLRNDIVVGILLWNIFSKISVARKVINEAQHYEDLTEVAKLFELDDDPEAAEE